MDTDFRRYDVIPAEAGIVIAKKYVNGDTYCMKSVEILSQIKSRIICFIYHWQYLLRFSACNLSVRAIQNQAIICADKGEKFSAIQKQFPAKQ